MHCKNGGSVTEAKIKGFYENLEWHQGQGDLLKTEQFLLKWLRWAENEENCLQSDRIAIYSEIGSFYRNIGLHMQSLTAFQRAEAIAAEAKDNSQCATILNNMGGTYRLIKDYRCAEVSFLEALEYCHLQGKQESRDYASILKNLSLVYQETGQTRKAIAYLEQALALLEDLPRKGLEAAILLNNLTALYHGQGDGDNAIRCLNRALEELEASPAEEHSHYGEVLNSLAGFLYRSGDGGRALLLYQKSAEHTRNFFGETLEYGITLQNIRWVHESLGERKKAIAALTEAKRVYGQLLGQEHERTCAASASTGPRSC